MSIPSLLLYNHKNNLLINSETFHTKSQQRLSKVLILLRWKMIGVNDVSLVNCYFTASLKVKTFLGSGSFGEVKKIYVFHGIPLVEKEIAFRWKIGCCTFAQEQHHQGNFFPDFPPLIFFIPSIANRVDVSNWKSKCLFPGSLNCPQAIPLQELGRSFIGRRIKLCLFKAFAFVELEQRNVFCNSTFAESSANIFLQGVYLQQVEMYFCKA